jgi:hypothetical protein
MKKGIVLLIVFVTALVAAAPLPAGGDQEPAEQQPQRPRGQSEMEAPTSPPQREFAVGEFHIGNAISSVGTWTTGWIFADLMKYAGYEAEIGDTRPSRMWAPIVDGMWMGSRIHDVRTDELGWPTSMELTGGTRADRLVAGVANALGLPNAFPDGIYRVLYEGTGELAFDGAGVVAEPTPGEIRIEYSGSTELLVSILETDPEGTGDYLRNIRILMPGATDGQRFTEEYLDYLRPFAVIRPMHFWGEQLIYGPRIAWKDRKQEEYSHWGGALGAPYDVAIDLANQSQSDLWVNLPIAASEDWARRLAELTLAELDADRRLYIELGNEIWNRAEPYSAGFDYALEHARDRWPGVEGTVRPYSVGDEVHEAMLAFSWQGARTVELGAIFREVWGDESERVVVVLAGQIGASAPYWHPSTYLLGSPVWVGEEGAEPAGEQVDAFAVAPYISDPPEPFGFSRGSAQAFLSDAITSVRGEGAWSESSEEPGLRYLIRWDKQLAARYGLPLVAYEGGQHFTGSRFTRDEVNTHPMMYDLYRTLFDVWQEEGGGLLNHFAGIRPRGQSPPGQEPSYFQSENFGIKETQMQRPGEAPKWRAVLDEMIEIGQIPAP